MAERSHRKDRFQPHWLCISYHPSIWTSRDPIVLWQVLWLWDDHVITPAFQVPWPQKSLGGCNWAPATERPRLNTCSFSVQCKYIRTKTYTCKWSKQMWLISSSGRIRSSFPGLYLIGAHTSCLLDYFRILILQIGISVHCKYDTLNTECFSCLVLYKTGICFHLQQLTFQEILRCSGYWLKRKQKITVIEQRFTTFSISWSIKSKADAVAIGSECAPRCQENPVTVFSRLIPHYPD